MVPAQFMLRAIAMSSDAGAQFPYFRNEFSSAQLFQIVVHISDS
jgi:hypothetical protein